MDQLFLVFVGVHLLSSAVHIVEIEDTIAVSVVYIEEKLEFVFPNLIPSDVERGWR